MKQSVSTTKWFLSGNTDGGGKPTLRSFPHLSIPGTGPGRTKPIDLTIKNGTGYTVSRQEIRNEQCVEHLVNPTTHLPYESFYATQQAYPLGIFADPLRYETGLLTAANNAARKMARGRSVNLANMLGEYRKTAKLFPELVEKLYRATMAVHHRDPRILFYGYWYTVNSRYGGFRPGVAKRTANNLSNEWLRYIYGVRPLMKDMGGALNVLAQRKDWQPPPLRVDATKRQKSNRHIVDRDAWGRPCEVYYLSQKSVKVIADIEFSNQVLNQTLGQFGLTNIAGVAWELTPYSFVVDWWINIGELIESLDNSLYFNGSSWAQSITRYRQQILVSVLGGSGSGIYSSYSRSSPYTLGTIATPVLNLSPSLIHAANGLALLTKLAKLRPPAHP